MTFDLILPMGIILKCRNDGNEPYRRSERGSKGEPENSVTMIMEIGKRERWERISQSSASNNITEKISTDIITVM